MTLLPWLICILCCTQYYTWNWSRRRLRRRFMYLVVSEFDILPKYLGGKSNCNLYFVSVFGTLSYGWNGLVYEANLAEKATFATLYYYLSCHHSDTTRLLPKRPSKNDTHLSMFACTFSLYDRVIFHISHIFKLS